MPIPNKNRSGASGKQQQSLGPVIFYWFHDSMIQKTSSQNTSSVSTNSHLFAVRYFALSLVLSIQDVGTLAGAASKARDWMHCPSAGAHLHFNALIFPIKMGTDFTVTLETPPRTWCRTDLLVAPTMTFPPHPPNLKSTVSSKVTCPMSWANAYIRLTDYLLTKILFDTPLETNFLRPAYSNEGPNRTGA